MAKIYNSEVTKELANNAGIQQNVNRTPDELAEKIVPTFETNPLMFKRINIYQHSSAVNASSSVIYTTPIDQDFYLCGGYVSVIKDATATSAASYISFYDINGNLLRFCEISELTLTAQENNIVIDLNRPIKIKRGTAISLVNSTANANIASRCAIWGYVKESSN